MGETRIDLLHLLIAAVQTLGRQAAAVLLAVPSARLALGDLLA